MVDLELLSAELQCQIEKYKLEKMNLQQSVKTLSRQEERLSRTSLTERRRSPGRLYDLLADKNSSFHLTKSRLSSDDESEDESVYDVRKALERLVHVSETDTVYDISKSYSEPDSETESV